MIRRHKRQTPLAGPCTTARPRGVDHTVRHTDRPAPEGGRRRDLAGSQSDDRPAFPRFRSDAHPLAKVDVEGSNPFSRSKKACKISRSARPGQLPPTCCPPMLSTLLSIGDPPTVTSWTCAKRLGVVFLDGFVRRGSPVTIRNTVKPRARCLDTVGVVGSKPIAPTRKAAEN